MHASPSLQHVWHLGTSQPPAIVWPPGTYARKPQPPARLASGHQHQPPAIVWSLGTYTCTTYICMHAHPIACTNTGPDKRRFCFYVLVSGTLLLSQGLLADRTDPEGVQMLSLRKRKHVQPFIHVSFHCQAKCFHCASSFLFLQPHGRPFAKNQPSPSLSTQAPAAT